MVPNNFVKLLLAPFSLLYGLGVSLRNLFYRQGLLKGVSFNLPVISVGNLSVGGAGKTPHIEYLIQLLRPYLNLATLSRGYKRKTKGFLIIHPDMTAEQAGDEPLQFKRKFPDVLVTVGENRTFAIPEILSQHPDRQVILLDDAFQHRSIQPGLNILLTEFSYPFTRDYLLPSGRLREWRGAYQRADIIIVSKCPPLLTEEQRNAMTREISPLPRQRLYFSYYDYDRPYYLFDRRYVAELQPDWEVLLICAIARTDYLVDYLEEKVSKVRILEYEDHHHFTKYDVGHLKANFDRMKAPKKLIITTEKDAMRLEIHKQFLIDNKAPIFALPVSVQFHGDDGPRFDQDIKDYLLNFKV
jgi:tetraacyldisaccharide 4'-kinase